MPKEPRFLTISSISLSLVFPSLIERNPAIFQENKIVFITGRVDNRNGERKFVAEEIEEIVGK